MAKAAGKTTRERILEAATALLREGGAAQASARNICEKAAITPPTLYHHFGDLAGLHAAAVAHAFAEQAKKKRRPRSPGAMEDLRRSWDDYVGFAQEQPALFAAMTAQLGTGKLPETALAAYATLAEDVARLESERGLRVSAPLATQMLFAAAQGAATLLSLGKDALPAPAERKLVHELREATLAAIAK